MDLVKINFMNYVIIKEKLFVLLKVSLVRFLEDIVMCNGIMKEKILLSLLYNFSKYDSFLFSLSKNSKHASLKKSWELYGTSDTC